MGESIPINVKAQNPSKKSFYIHKEIIQTISISAPHYNKQFKESRLATTSYKEVENSPVFEKLFFDLVVPQTSENEGTSSNSILPSCERNYFQIRHTLRLTIQFTSLLEKLSNHNYQLEIPIHVYDVICEE